MAKQRKAASRAETRVARQPRPLSAAARRAATRRTAVSGIKRRKQQFAAAHVKGMEALRTKDYDALGDAILEERKLIQQQALLVKAVATAKPPKRKR